MNVIFVISVFAILYTYLLYPLIITVWGTIARRRPFREHSPLPLSVVLAVRDEEDKIAARLDNLLAQEYPAGLMEIIVVSDGSTDGTVEAASRYAGDTVTVLDTGEAVGKAMALNRGVEAAANGLIVFADARQRFSSTVFAELSSMFHDESVGCVSGELVFAGKGASDVQEGVDLYWRYEKLIRRKESDVDSVVGATGSIYAVRKELFAPLPAGTILDDFLLPMRIVLQGHRVLFNRAAQAFDTVAETGSREFNRKVRTLAGNFQALRFEPALLNPIKNRIWFQLVSHKVMRLLAPYFCIAAFVSNLFLSGEIFGAALLLQMLFYGSVLLKFTPLGRSPIGRLVRISWTFVMLNAAAVAGFWVFLTGRETTVWKK
jgi:biofilm PGA synthesis N-glycosyltransferase PgaC